MKVIVKFPKDHPPAIFFEILTLPTIGPLLVAKDDDGLCFIGMTDEIKRLQKQYPKSVLIREARLQKLQKPIMTLWQKGIINKEAFPLPFVLRGTAFQVKVWRALLKIKKGEACSYQELAQKMGAPLAVRAVASAVGKNPISLLIPCHRVLAQNKKDRLKFGWGAKAKARLLKAEGIEF